MPKALLPLLLLFSSQADPGPYAFVGPMSQYLATGAQVAPVTKGLPFTIVLEGAGDKIAPTSFSLKGEGWKGAAELQFSDLNYADGSLSGTVSLTNKAGAGLQGLRLDVLTATEEYRTKDEKGQEKLATRSQPLRFESPLLFGDLLPGEDQGGIEFRVSNLKFIEDTTKISVSGVLSGLRHVGAWVPQDDYRPSTLSSPSTARSTERTSAPAWSPGTMPRAKAAHSTTSNRKRWALPVIP
jgi:hypothetical protein